MTEKTVDENETIPDILAEHRKILENMRQACELDERATLSMLLYRVGAAYDRMTAQGNDSAMRNALLKIRAQNGYPGDGENGPLSHYIHEYATEGLSAPPRNCDVHPTFKTALLAFRDFCWKNGRVWQCAGCAALPDGREPNCVGAWLYHSADGQAKKEDQA